MPQINRIRVNNVRYNFGTQFYDDFVMRFSCKNTIYDLANGGGKSVLMLLLLQNLIPNCTLDEKQPVEKLFRTGGGSSTIHSLIEWKLDSEAVKNNYKYMLTGFCARKAKDGEDDGTAENAAIEYFNYCIFYREFNDNDIKNLPLSSGKERITYNGLKSYLRELEKKDFSLEVRIFERKGEYQRFIAQYGLYESQWEIIRGINKTEGHVRTYFETNYKTTRKVVEDLLIEEIIEKSFNARVAADSDSGAAMAKTLLDIKDKLIELARRKEDIGSYDRQMEAIKSFIPRISAIRQLYFGRERLTEQLIKAYNTLKAVMADREKELELCSAKEQELAADRDGLNRRIDTIKVQKTENDIRRLTETIDELSVRLASQRAERNKKSKDLLVMESENDYADYLYYRSERDSIKAAIDNMSGGDADREKAELRLAAMGNERIRRLKTKTQNIEAEISKEQDSLRQENAVISENEQKEDKYIQDISVAEYMAGDCESRLSRLNTAIYKEKESIGVIMNTDMAAELRMCQAEADRLRDSQERTASELVQAALDSKTAAYERNDISLRTEAAEEALIRLSQQREENSRIEARYEKLKELYGENSADALYGTVSDRYRETSGEAAAAGERLTSLKRYASNLEKGCPVGDSAEVCAVLEYIEKYHGGTAVSGSGYMAGLDSGERADIMNRLPLLPYSVVIKSGYGRITADAGLKTILVSDYAVPLIKQEALENGGYMPDMSAVSFVMRDDSLFTDKDALDREKEKTQEQLRDTQETAARLAEAEILLGEDLDFIKEYRDIYRERIQRDDREYDENRLLIKKLASDMEAVKLRELEAAERDGRLHEKADEIRRSRRELDVRTETVERIISMDRETAELEQKIRSLRIDAAALKKEYLDISARLKAQKESAGYRENHINALRADIAAAEESWSRIYKPYYKEMESIDAFGLDTMSDEELDAEARALAELVSGQQRDIMDKRRLMENFDIAMEKSLQAIDYKGIELEMIKQGFETGAARQHTNEELKSFKSLLDGVDASIRHMEDELSCQRSARDRMEGAAGHGRNAIAEKYGAFERETADELSYDRILVESRSAIESTDRLAEELKRKAEAIREASKDYIIYKRDLDKIIESAHITCADEDGVWEERSNLTERLEAVSAEYESYRSEVQAKREELEHEKNLLADTLRALSAYGLSDEVKNNITMPQSIAEAEELLGALSEIISCIQLERGQIEKNISDMERIKDSFENQCIQSCVNIKTELERLSKLSKIYMDGEAISIIGLHIPYIREEAYKQHMSAYIDDIVENADGLKSDEERIKYIRNQLSWKKLFSVIVTDMNSIRLMLYKRERIKEQSRYLRYEEAVGSTGQSQGIYIQFLIAIINYITSINSGNSESRNIGKVVFIDNPFGAAKDVYIWEPIFKMLKTNNVQLIVPCRGATPAITGRFDVNYILGQKMTDGKQQTVVVEYYSNVESDAVEYEKLSFEQGQFIFE